MQNGSRIFAIISRPTRTALAISLILIPVLAGTSAPATAQEAVQGNEALSVAPTPVVPQQVRYAGKLATRASETVE